MLSVNVDVGTPVKVRQAPAERAVFTLIELLKEPRGTKSSSAGISWDQLTGSPCVCGMLLRSFLLF